MIGSWNDDGAGYDYHDEKPEDRCPWPCLMRVVDCDKHRAAVLDEALRVAQVAAERRGAP